jgi:uncharacterized membrane protein
MRFQRGAVRLPRRPTVKTNGAQNHPEHIATTVEEIIRLENRDHSAMGFSDRVASRITAFSGSMLYVWLHVAWFSIWILVNVAVIFFEPFDSYPFGLLTMIVSLEAIFLSTFVLITQNRQAMVADRRAKVDLQVDMIAEREITKLIRMVTDIHDHLGMDHSHDQELEEMKKATHVEKLADAIDAAEEESDPEAVRGPERAADGQG